MKVLDPFYANVQSEYGFSDFEIAKMNYTLSMIFLEGTKLLILLALAILFQCVNEYVVATLVLLSIRSISGGLHFDHYISCFGFTLGFFVLSIALSMFAPVTYAIQVITLFICLIALYLTGPVLSKNRPQLSAESFQRTRYIGCGVFLIFLIFFICNKTFPFRDLWYWVLVLQITQLICAKLTKKGE